MKNEYHIDMKYVKTLEVKFGFTMRGHRQICHTVLDHPAFAAIRKQLVDDGMVKVEENSFDGDTVLKKFKLNKHIFKAGDEFPTGADSRYVMHLYRKYN